MAPSTIKPFRNFIKIIKFFDVRPLCTSIQFLGLGRSDSFDITKLTWARREARCDVNQKHDYTTLENQPESLINEAIFLISRDDSSVKLIRNGEPNNLYLHLARERHWQRKWIAVSSFSTALYPRQKLLNGSLVLSACLPITQWPLNTVTVVEMISRPSPNNLLVCILSITSIQYGRKKLWL